MRRVTRERAFSLLEIFVAVAVIGVFAMIALPALKDMRQLSGVRPGVLTVKHEDGSTVSAAALIDKIMLASYGGAETQQSLQLALKDKLESATAIFNTPSEIGLSETKTIKLVISRRKSDSQLVPEVQKYGQSKAAQIEVGNTMQAILVSDDQDGLTIVEKTPKIQDVSTTSETYWLWDAKAKKSGTYKLTLTIAIDSDLQGVRMQRAIKTHEEDIIVEVTWTKWLEDFVSENWQWLWAVFIGPLGLWAWKRWRAKQRAKKKPENAASKPDAAEKDG
jgi:prepilin-type N-terminal cleavage/methylation domain-containing protein